MIPFYFEQSPLWFPSSPAAQLPFQSTTVQVQLGQGTEALPFYSSESLLFKLSLPVAVGWEATEPYSGITLSNVPHTSVWLSGPSSLLIFGDFRDFHNGLEGWCNHVSKLLGFVKGRYSPTSLCRQ